MKKAILVVTFIFIGLFIVACGSSDEKSQPTHADKAEENKQDQRKEEQKPQKEDNQTEKSAVNEAPNPTYKVSDNATIVPIDENTNEKVVLLTIDDIPDKHALDMAKTLKELEANAIFFVNGHFLETEEQKDMLKQIHEMGFVIGNHTYSHPKLPDLTEQEQTEEIVRVNDQIEEVIGERPKFFRAPHGMNSDHSRQVAKEQGMVVMNWTYGYDYFAPYQDAAKLKKAMVSGEGPEAGVDYSLLKPGANLLMHDREWTNEALADIVKGLRDKGYEMVDPKQIQTLSKQ
ncbi:polysaccharide deacetylase family protein [Virgibacillus sp. Bac330]|uniref:polysaccharide deacetylase family protein n=1 Tax=Virgibacillus sp. Bac330 TaxID=2419841 RepID=UPI000EF4B7A7|nr:polysaccharide deacetylase family protein [Virgibacillus sp. Bac330]